MTLLSLPIFTFATIKVKIIKRKRVSFDFPNTRERYFDSFLSILVNFDPLSDFDYSKYQNGSKYTKIKVQGK